MKLFTKEIDKKLAAQYHLGADLNAQVVVAKIFNPYGNGRWYLINSDPSDPDYLWAIVQIGDIVEVGSVSRKELENLRVGRLRFPLERDLGFSQRNAQEVYNGVVMGKTYAKGGMADVTPTYAAGGEISPETLTKFAEDLQQAESEAYDNLDIRSGGQLYRTPSLQKQYASAMNQAFAELTKKHAHLKDINVENGQTIYDILEDQNYHTLNNYLALRGIFGTKYKQKYEGYHTKYPDNYLDPANMVGAQSYAVGGLTPGRWYKDNQGVEYKFIGKIDNGPNKDQLLFTDGTQKTYKTIDEFGGAPKENKLFGWFGDGGEIFKYVQNTFKDENGVVRIDAYTTSEDDDDEDYDEDEGNIVAYVFPDGRVAYLDARAKYDKNVQKVIKESGGNDVIEDLFEIEEYLPEEVQSILKKYQEGLIDADYDVLKKAKKELESVGFTFDYGLGGGAFDLQVVDDLDSMSYMADGGKKAIIDEVSSMSFSDNYDDYEMVVISKELDKDGGRLLKDRFLVSAKDIGEAKSLASDLWREQYGRSDLRIVKVMSDEAYRHNYMGKMADGGSVHFEKIWSVEKNGSAYMLGPYTYQEAKEIIDDEYKNDPTNAYYRIVKYNSGYMADGGKLNIGTIKKTDTDVLFDKKNGTFYVNVIDGGGNRVNKIDVNTIDDVFAKYPTFRLNTKGEKEFPESMADGGMVTKYNVSFNYNPSNLKNKDAQKIVESYTKDWKHDNDFDEVSFFAMRLNKEESDSLVKELKMEDVYNIEVDKSSYADGGLIKEIKLFEKYNYPKPKTKGDKVRAIFEHFEKKGYTKDEINKTLGEMKYADGGKVKFADKVKSIQASLLKRKKVAPSVQKDYGKTYNKAEAKEAATRITGAMTAKERLMAKKKK